MRKADRCRGLEIQLDPRIGQLIADQVRSPPARPLSGPTSEQLEAEDTSALCQQENTELAEQLADVTSALEDVRAQREQQAGTIAELREGFGSYRPRRAGGNRGG